MAVRYTARKTAMSVISTVSIDTLRGAAIFDIIGLSKTNRAK